MLPSTPQLAPTNCSVLRIVRGSAPFTDTFWSLLLGNESHPVPVRGKERLCGTLGAGDRFGFEFIQGTKEELPLPILLDDVS